MTSPANRLLGIFPSVVVRGSTLAVLVATLAACQITFPVKPRLELSQAPRAQENDPVVEVRGVKLFDRMVHPLTIVCRAAELPVTFSGEAMRGIENLVLRKLSEGKAGGEIQKITIEVTDVMMRVMALIVPDGGQPVAEARISLLATVMSASGAPRRLEASYQSLVRGKKKSDAPCSRGAEALRQALVEALEGSVEEIFTDKV